MAVLSNFPKISQRSDITADHRASENKAQNCVPTCLCAGAMYLNGIHDEGGKYTSDSWKDGAYGENYTGATAAAAYINYAKALGIKLYPIDGEPNYLIHQAHVHLQEEHPVIITIPDPWVDINLEQYKGWSHVNVFKAEIPGGLTALDPWPGEDVSKSDATWASLLQYKQIWIMQKEEEVVTIDIHNPEIAKHFKELNVHQWECTDTGGPWQGKVIQYALLDNYKHEGNKGLCGFDVLGRPMSNEIYINQNWVIQFYEFGVRQWKDQKVSPVALYDGGPGTDPELAKLKRQLAAQPQTQALVDAISAIKAIVAKV